MQPLTEDEFSELILSVGIHRNRRVLRPMDVARRIKRAFDAGVLPEGRPLPPDKLAKALGFKGKDMISRFLSLLNIPEDFQGFVDWGAGKGELTHLTFSIATSIAALGIEQQQELLTEIFKHELTKHETMMAVQALKRDPSKAVGEAVAVALTTRPIKIEHEILIGSFPPENQMSKQDIPAGRKEAIILAALRGIFEGEPIAARVSDKHFVLSTSVKGKKLLNRHCSSLGVEPNELIAKLCEEKLAS